LHRYAQLRSDPALAGDTERQVLNGVAWLTLASGALQAVAPRLILNRLARRPDALSTHLFGTVGMFMTVSGGVLAASLRLSATDQSGPLAWCAAQKIGAATAVAIGVRRRVLSPLALGVAAFDLASGVLTLHYRRRTAH
jgi:hypothetical protein